jgi:hypothetical protein
MLTKIFDIRVAASNRPRTGHPADKASKLHKSHTQRDPNLDPSSDGEGSGGIEGNRQTLSHALFTQRSRASER